MGLPDMRVPIAYALSYPERLELDMRRLALSQCGNLEFSEPDYRRFPALGLAFEALRQGGVLPAVLNGANEVAVESFLDGKLSFNGISLLVEKTMEKVSAGSDSNIDDILQADLEARVVAKQLLQSL
jgi:1-deoxy-D-xylulose-5-phosphate reductoisomerase